MEDIFTPIAEGMAQHFRQLFPGFIVEVQTLMSGPSKAGKKAILLSQRLVLEDSPHAVLVPDFPAALVTLEPEGPRVEAYMVNGGELPVDYAPAPGHQLSTHKYQMAYEDPALVDDIVSILREAIVEPAPEDADTNHDDLATGGRPG